MFQSPYRHENYWPNCLSYFLFALVQSFESVKALKKKLNSNGMSGDFVLSHFCINLKTG